VANQIEFRAVRLLAAADGGGTYLFRFDPGAQQLDALEMDAAGGAATNFERHACIDAMFGDGPPPGEPSFVPPATPFGYDGTEPLFIVADLPATAATANFNVYDVADGGDQYTYWSFVTIAEITEDAAVDVREIPDLAELFADPGGGEGCEVRLVVTPRQVLYEP
jgi:hypothetical protein